MAKIILSNSEKLDISFEEANRIAALWRDPGYKSTIRIGDREIKKHLIRKIEYEQRGIIGEYDLSNQNHKDVVREFERDLGRFEGPWAFELWCVEQGLYTRVKVIEVEMPDGRKFKRLAEFSIVKDRADDYEDAKNKLKALQALQRSRFEAKRHEHMDFLAGGECPDKPGSGKRCEFCYPIVLHEKYPMLAIKPFVGVPSAEVKGGKDGIVEVEDNPRVMFEKAKEALEKADNRPHDIVAPIINKEFEDDICPRCFEPMNKCECVKLEDVPF